MNVVAMPSAKVPSMRDRVSQAEWDTRVELAALYRVAAYMGLEDLTANHFAAREPVPDQADGVAVFGSHCLQPVLL